MFGPRFRRYFFVTYSTSGLIIWNPPVDVGRWVPTKPERATFVVKVMMKLPAGVALLTSMTLASMAAGQPEPRWIILNRTARQAVQARNYSKLKETLTALLPLMPGNPRIMYNLAAADAHLGDAAGALEQLRTLAGAGLIYDFNSDEDFSPLRGAAGFNSILRQVEENRKPVAHAAPVSNLSERDLLPEDLAYDPHTHRFLIGSVTRCKIVTADGQVFAQSNWPVMALRVDAGRRILWAATGWIANCEHCYDSDRDKSALLAFDLDSGALLKRFNCPIKGLLGDMTISRAGDVYLSEGLYGGVLRLKAESSTMERLDPPGEFRSPQTPALSADERTLYVPDYVRGIAALNLKTRTVQWLAPAKNIVLAGIDGFYRYGSGFIAVQNGVRPERVVFFSSDLAKQEILDTNTPGLGEPTHGTVVGDAFYFIANTGWDAYGDDGKKKPESAPVASQIRRIALGKR